MRKKRTFEVKLCEHALNVFLQNDALLSCEWDL